MHITILTHIEDPDEPEIDPVVGQVESALVENGHRVERLVVHGDVNQLIDGLRAQRPELVFNLLEMFGDNVNGDVPVAGVMDALGLRYTGCGPGELYLANDKALAKKILAFENIPYPRFAVFGGKDAELETGGNLRMPLFVKPARMDASIGIDAAGLVHDATTLMKRVAMIHEEVGDAALAEEYIEGREFHVGVLGNGEATPLPPIEIDFSGLPDGRPHVLDAKAKWDEKSVEFKGTKSVVADLPDELRAKLLKVSQNAYRALRVKDYGRVDLRLTDTGDIYVLEVNASCYLEKESEFAMAAREAGLEFPALVQKIVDLAMARYGK